MTKRRTKTRELAIVAGVRTPFCRAQGALAGASAADLGAFALREVLDRTGLDPAVVDEVILGCAGADAREANVARVAALRAGLPEQTPAVTVMRNCASGLESLVAARQALVERLAAVLHRGRGGAQRVPRLLVRMHT